MTETEAETCQQWRGMDGRTAFHLIERHADGWEDIAMMMGAWHRANTEDDKADAAEAERAECAELLRLSNSELLLLAGEMTAQELRTAQAVLKNRADAIMNRPTLKVNGLSRFWRSSISTDGLGTGSEK